MHFSAPLFAGFVAFALLSACVRQPPADSVSAPGSLELMPVALLPHDTLAVGTIRGRLLTDHPAVSVVGATIELPDARLATTADSGGAFELRGVPLGRQRFWVRRFGFQPTRGSIDVPRGGGAVLRVWLETQKVCLDYCPAAPPRAYGRIEAVP